jgi:hypothetical protein
MTFLNTINIGNTDFGIANSTILGVCTTPAGSEVKVCSFADNFELKAGLVITIKFTYANTYGDGSTTYPKLSVNGTTGAIRNASGVYASSGAWQNQSLVPFIYDGTDFSLLTGSVTDTVEAGNAYPVSSQGVYNAVSAEATARTNADSDLSSAISAEATARANADSSLTNSINSVSSSVNTVSQRVSDLTSAVSAETTARTNADNALSSDISAEATARANAVSAEATARTNADNTLSSAISAEATARTNADNALSSDITSVSGTASAALSSAQYANKKCARVSYSDLGFSSSSPSSNIMFASFITRIASYLGASKDVVMIQPVNNVGITINVELDNGTSYSLDNVLYIGNIIDDYTVILGEHKETTGLLISLNGQDSWIILQDYYSQLARKISLTT